MYKNVLSSSAQKGASQSFFLAHKHHHSLKSSTLASISNHTYQDTYIPRDIDRHRNPPSQTMAYIKQYNFASYLRDHPHHMPTVSSLAPLRISDSFAENWEAQEEKLKWKRRLETSGDGDEEMEERVYFEPRWCRLVPEFVEVEMTDQECEELEVVEVEMRDEENEMDADDEEKEEEEDSEMTD